MKSDAQPVIVWGASGHARVVADVLRLGGRRVRAFVDELNRERRGQDFCDAPVIGPNEVPALLHEGVGHFIIGIGDCAARLRLAEQALALGLEPVTAVHPSAVVARDACIGAGSLLCAGSIVCPGAQLGAHVIINTAATVDHDCVLEDGVHVAPGAHLAGTVRVGRGAMIGLGSVVKERVTIGAGALIGAGSVVVRNIPGGVVAFGSPARVRRPLP